MAEPKGGDTETTFTVSVAASLAGMHAQTLRQYDRLGLVSPARTKGRGRRYSRADLERLRYIQQMTQESGINLAGVQKVLGLEDELVSLRQEIARLTAVVAKSAAPTRSVFLADSTGNVRIRPHVNVPAVPDSETGGAKKVLTQTQVALQGARQAGALELAQRRGHALVRTQLTGWQLLAALRVQQKFDRMREGRK